MGDPAGVCAVVVVVGEVGAELALEAAVAEVEVAGERGAPAFLEDRAVESFDVSVGLWPSGVDAAVLGVESGDGGGEGGALELVAVIGENALQPPASGLEIAGDALDQP